MIAVYFIELKKMLLTYVTSCVAIRFASKSILSRENINDIQTSLVF